MVPARLRRLLSPPAFPGLLAGSILAAACLIVTTHLSSTAYYHVAFSFSVCGGAMASIRLRGDRWMLLQRPVREQARVELLHSLLWSGGPGLLFLMAAALVRPAWSPTDALSLGLSCAHVGALTFLVQRSPLPTRLPPLALVALVWWFPAVAPALQGLLDASPRLAHSPTAPDTWKALAPIGALVLAAFLLPRAGRIQQ